MNQSSKLKTGVIIAMILIAAFSRIIPHWPNFTALGAMALFGAAHLNSKWLAVIIPLIALFLSDLFINNIIYGSYYDSFMWMISPFVYIGIAAIIGVGFLIRSKIKPQNVVLASLSASVLFFVFTNFGAWAASPIYTKDMAGLVTAYAAGVPFFWGTLAGDLFYCGVLFGGFALVANQIPAFQQAKQLQTENLLDQES